MPNISSAPSSFDFFNGALSGKQRPSEFGASAIILRYIAVVNVGFVVVFVVVVFFLSLMRTPYSCSLGRFIFHGGLHAS